MDPSFTSALRASESADDASARRHAAHRRRFLALLATGTAATVAPSLPATAAPVVADDADAAARGYRHTEHVGKYYATARL
ncbi:MAG: formate dehydrogenase [Burkholderiales bacterium]